MVMMKCWFDSDFQVSSGVEYGNMRELALERMMDMGTTCRDVRTREVGIQEIHNKGIHIVFSSMHVTLYI